MSRRRKHQEEEGHPLVHDESNWLVSYADMMTLLFGFFILMYSMSRVDSEKFEVVRKDIVKYFGGPLTENPGALNLKAKMETVMDQFNGAEGEENKLVSFHISSNTLRMALQSQVLFSSGAAELSLESARMIDKISQELKNVAIEEIEVEGHTDPEPIRSSVFPSNWELSSARSSRIVRRMIENGLVATKLTAKGYADSRPDVPHYNADGALITENKIKNRRVVLVVKLAQSQSKEKEMLEKQGFRGLASDRALTPSSPAIETPVLPTAETKDLKQKLLDAQLRYTKATEQLKSAQDLEKSIKEMEMMAKKAEDIERRIQSIEKKTDETINRAQKAKDGIRPQ